MPLWKRSGQGSASDQEQEANREAQAALHDLLHSVQSALALAEDRAAKEFGYSVNELEVTASFDFAFDQKMGEAATAEEERRSSAERMSIWTTSGATQLDRPSQSSSQESGKLTLRVLLKPGGRHLASGGQPGGDAPAAHSEVADLADAFGASPMDESAGRAGFGPTSPAPKDWNSDPSANHDKDLGGF